ncbi:MAG TPA: PA14 domain-containing protein [Kofleriaceae bacterium]|nr:PA14 domain-containing protein [Kofleriaceae bacterium]
MRCVMAISALVLGVPACAFTPAGQAGDDAPDDAGTDDAGNRRVSVRDDLAADFAATGAAVDAAVIEPYGALGPAAYVAGALLAGFSNDERFTDATAATWDQVVTGGSTGTSLWSYFRTPTPRGLGQTGGDSWTYWAEGEIYLTAGTNTLILRADDAGFVDIAGDNGWTRVAVATYLAEGTGAITVVDNGWYPVRVAMHQGIGEAELGLFVRDAGQQIVRLPRERLRGRVDGLRGLFLTAWDAEYFAGPPAVTLDTTVLAHRDWAGGNPTDLGLADGNNWSARWAGQLHVDQPGTYQLRYASDDGQRLYLAGERRSQTWQIAQGVVAEISAELAAGWNDLVIDVNEVTGDARAQLTLVGGPDGVTGPLPLERLRPLEPRSERLALAHEPADATIPNNQPTGVDAFLPVAAPEGATITGVDLMVTVDHGAIGDLELRLYHPDGTELLLRDNDNSGGNGTRTFRFFDLAQLAGKPAGGRYVVRLSDTRPGGNGSRTDLSLVVHYRGGPDQVARSGTYTSPVRDLGAGVVAIDAVRFGATVPAGAAVAIRLRGCDDPTACASQPWSGPFTDPAGGPVGLPPTRYLQYRVELTSDGERGAEVDWVEVDYRLPQD